jgi:arsenite/tail-anchored protein-transporting ATPase
LSQPRDWLSRELLFFGGKGGVGKTTCATTFALVAAEQGKKTLLVSTDPAHSTSDILERRLDDTAQRLNAHLWALELNAEREAQRYLEQVKAHLRGVIKPKLRSEIDRQLELAQAAPGAEEAALFDRIAELIQELQTRFELIIFDTAPTGHTLRLLSLPELMQAWIDGLISRREQVNDMTRMWRSISGHDTEAKTEDPINTVLQARRRKFMQLRRALLDAQKSAFIFVLNPERLPIEETDKAMTLLGKYHIPIGGYIVNRVLPDDLPEHPFWTSRKRQEAQYLKEISERFAQHAHLTLPLFEADIVGEARLLELAHCLKARL